MLSPYTTVAVDRVPVFYDNGDHHPQQGTLLGFWLYLMSDCLVFAVLFATYAVLGRSYAAGPSGADLFDLPLVAVNTGLLGLGFLSIELYEFAHLLHEGAGPQRSAFLSAFFTLVGTHGLHVAFGTV